MTHPQGPHDPKPSQAGKTAPPTAASVRMLYAVGTGILVVACTSTAVLFTSRRGAVEAQRIALAKAADEGVGVLAAPVGTSAAVRKLVLPGEVRPLQSATVYAKLAGYLKELRVDKGDHVQAGQIIARVASPETDQQVLQRTAALNVAKQTEARYLTLVEGGSVSKQELDNATAAAKTAQADLNQALAMQSYALIRSPYTGVVTVRYADAGALLPAATASTQAAQPLVEVQDMSWVRVFIYVGQTEAPFIKAGAPVRLTSRDLPELAIDTVVTRVAGALDAHTRTMLVEVDVDNRSGVLTPGLYVQAALDVALPQAVTVPVDAIFLRGGVPYVAVLDGGVAKYTQVKTGYDDGRNVHILQGVSSGMHVGLHIGDAVSDGAKVRVIEPHHEQVPKRE